MSSHQTNKDKQNVIIFAIPSMYTITALPAERQVREMIPVSLYCHLVISALHSLKSSKLKLEIASRRSVSPDGTASRRSVSPDGT